MSPKSENTQTISIDDKISAKDLYNEFFRCRDFELQHLWQRSAFLAVFLLAIATAYGKFVSDNIAQFIDGEKTYLSHFIVYGCRKVKTVSEFVENDSADTYNLIALGLCAVEIVLAVLWLMMAKGSKRWYERYENAISFFAEKFTGDDIGKLILESSLHEKIKVCKNFPRFDDLPDLETDSCIFSIKAGKYSPSRINGFVGVVFLVVFMFWAVLHLCKFLCIKCAANHCKIIIVLTGIVTIISFVIAIKYVLAYFVKSEF